MIRTPPLERLIVSNARHFPVRRGKLRAVDALWRLASGDRSTRRLVTLTHGGFKVPCDLSEMLQRQLYFFGSYFVEEHIIRCWQREARQARMVFDVGANASLAAPAIRADLTVHAFEPSPEIADRLRQTVALNGLQMGCRPSMYIGRRCIATPAM